MSYRKICFKSEFTEGTIVAVTGFVSAIVLLSVVAAGADNVDTFVVNVVVDTNTFVFVGTECESSRFIK